jgi:hypothetical protein
MFFTGRPFGKTDELIHSPFVQFWDGEGIRPPPPPSQIMITELGDPMITESTGDYMITE